MWIDSAAESGCESVGGRVNGSLGFLSEGSWRAQREGENEIKEESEPL